MLANNNIIVKNTLELDTCIKHLEHTYAHGFYFSLGKNITHNHTLTKEQPIPVHTQLYNNICVWQFQYGQQDWRKPNNLLMSLYRKKDILNAITNLNYNSVDTLDTLWNNWSFDLENIGLFFNESKVFALQAEQKNILQLLHKNMKIDLTPLFLLQNNAILQNITCQLTDRSQINKKSHRSWLKNLFGEKHDA